MTFPQLTEVGVYLPIILTREVLVAGCEDSVYAVAKAAAAGVMNFISTLQAVKEGIMDFSPVIPSFLGVLRRFLANEEDALVILGFEHLQLIFTFPEPIINDHIEAIIEFIFSIFLYSDRDYDRSLKDVAADTFISLLQTQEFLKQEFIERTLSRLINRIAEEKGCVVNLSQEDAKNNVIRYCHEMIGVMAEEIPANCFVDIAFKIPEKALSSSDGGLRQAGFVVLGVTVASLRNESRERIETILPLLIEGLSDEDLHTREAASFALAQYAHYCYSEVNHYQHLILPAMIKVLDSNELVVARQCFSALGNLFQQVNSNTIKPYLSALVQCVGPLAQSNSPYIQAGAFSALSSIVSAAGTEFQPYADEIMPFLEPLLAIECESVCCEALVCLSRIALAVGKDQFKPCYYELGMKSCMEFLKSQSRRLKDTAFTHIGDMAELKGKDFEASMKEVMPYIFEALNENEVIIQKVYNDDGEATNQTKVYIQKDPTFVQKKVTVITAVGSLARHTTSCFLPYLQPIILIFIAEDARILHSFNVEIRLKAILVLSELLEMVADLANLPVPSKNERLKLPDQVLDVLEMVLLHCFDGLDRDHVKKVVSKVILILVSILERLGASVLDMNIPYEYDEGVKVSILLAQRILTFLNGKGPCQKIQPLYEDDDDEGEEDKSNYFLMDSFYKLIGTLAKVLSGDEFITYFDQFQSQLLRFSQSQTEHNMAICCYADVFESLGSLSMKYADSILPVLKSDLADRDGLETTRQNAAYCLGVLVEAGGKGLVPRFLEFLQWLHPLCIRGEDEEDDEVNDGGADVDNAVAAVAKMIVVSPEAIPLSPVLPVMLAALPMREDFGESTVVFKAFLHLIENNDVTIIGMAKEVIGLLADSFKPDSEVPEAAKDLAGRAITLLAKNMS